MSDPAAIAGDDSPIILDSAHPDTVNQAAAILRSGGLISFPTDTVYALAAAVNQPAALEAIYKAKGRSLTKAIPILLASSAEIGQVAKPIDDRTRQFVEALWPGPLTVVLPAKTSLPEAVTVPSSGGSRTVAVRVPDHDLARSLIDRAGGAVAATSANLSGQPPAVTAEAAVTQLGSRLKAVVDGGTAPGGVASTIIALRQSGFEILRQGDVTVTELERLWENSRQE